MKRIYVIILLLALSVSAFSQYRIQGQIVDSTDTPLAFTSIALTNKSDSLLVSFAVTNKLGKFEMKQIPKGDFRLQLSYMGYKNMFMELKIDGSKTIYNLGKIELEEDNELLNSVSVSAQAIPILLKKDTIEYNAGSFKTQTNAVVEDLLKELPGIEVDKEGKIKAQGKEVEKILVDGKEFFGDDPKIASKNLSADMVDKVQVLDKKSDASEFTGIDDGERIKTINLTLKKSKKKGYFGMLKGGYGTENRYEASMNLNRFTKKMQISTIGMSNNINEQGFSINDYIDFMGGIQNLISGNGISFSTDDLGMSVGGGNNAGELTSGAGGINVNYEFAKHTKLNVNYFFNGMDNLTDRYTERTYINNPFLSSANEESEISTRHFSHKVNMKFNHRIDSVQDLMLKANVGYTDGRTDVNSLLNNYNLLSNLASVSSNNNSAKQNGLNFNTSILYRKKFAKKGRLASLRLNANNRSSDAGQDLHIIKTVNDSTFGSSINSRQYQTDDLSNLTYGGSISYTEPIGKVHYLSATYRYANTGDLSNHKYFDIFPQVSDEHILNPSLSNDLKSVLQRHTSGLSWRSNYKKLKFGAGLDYTHIAFNGKQNNTLDITPRNYQMLLPSFNMRYTINKQMSIQIYYSSYVNTPSMRQLQPKVDNSSLDQYYVGNPDLDPEYAQSASLNFHYYSMFSNISLFAGIQSSYTKNRISNSIVSDTSIIQTFMPVNNGNGENLMAHASFSSPLKILKLKYNISTQSMLDRGNFLYNQNLDKRLSFIQTLDANIENRKKEHANIKLGTRLNYNSTSYASNTNLNNSYLMPEYYLDLTIDFFKTWTVASYVTYITYPKEMLTQQQESIIWEAYLAKSIMKRKALIKLKVYDILDQNSGIQYYNQYDYSAWERSNTIGRYFMLSFSYSISAFGK